MKNTVVYYLAIITPLILIAYLFVGNYKTHFVFSLLAYVLVYRPVIDYLRLKSKGENIKFTEIYHPLIHLKKFKSLYM